MIFIPPPVLKDGGNSFPKGWGNTVIHDLTIHIYETINLSHIIACCIK